VPVLAGLVVVLLPQPASSPPATAAAASGPATLLIRIVDRSPSLKSRAAGTEDNALTSRGEVIASVNAKYRPVTA
jgi:hypothetical protein